MHVFVRARLLGHPEWDLDAWGVPISQADALLTLMGGSVAPGLGLRAMGFRPSREDIEATMHFWRYVGHLMGVRPRWYPESLREGVQLGFVALLKRANGAGEDGVRLCRSYAEAFAPESSPRATRDLEVRAPGANSCAPDAPLRVLSERLASLGRHARSRLSHRVHLGYTRFFLPPPIHRANGLPDAGIFALYPLACFPFVFATESLRRASPELDALGDRLARAHRRRWLERHTGGRAAEYRAVERFTR
jgi:hypothetical protein